MTNELAKIDSFRRIGNDLVVSLTGDITVLREKLEEKYPITSIPADLSNKENYNLVKASIKEIKKPRLLLEKDRKAIKDVPWQLCKQIDDAARPEREALEALEAPRKKAIADQDRFVVEEAAKVALLEQELVDAILNRIEVIRMLPIVNMDKTSSELIELYSDLSVGSEKGWGEYKERAEGTIAATLERLDTLTSDKKAQEDIARQNEEKEKKLEAERLETEKKAEATRVEREKKNREESERLAKERKKIDDANAKIEADKKKNADAAAKIEADKEAIEDTKALQKKKEAEAKAKKIADEKAADEAAKKVAKEEELRRKNHDKMFTATAKSLSPYLELEVEEIIKAIIAGKIKHVTFG